MPTDGMRTMISTKLAVVVAMLALTGTVAAQEVVDEDRIARLVEELMEIDDRSEVTHELVAIGEPAIPNPATKPRRPERGGFGACSGGSRPNEEAREFDSTGPVLHGGSSPSRRMAGSHPRHRKPSTSLVGPREGVICYNTRGQGELQSGPAKRPDRTSRRTPCRPLTRSSRRGGGRRPPDWERVLGFREAHPLEQGPE